VTWTDSEFTGSDILDVERSLGRPGRKLRIDLDSSAALVIKLNTMNRRYPEWGESKLFKYPTKNLTEEEVWMSDDASASEPSLAFSTGETEIMEYAVRNIEIVSMTAGDGISIEIW
jgi:hypothetical protein